MTVTHEPSVTVYSDLVIVLSDGQIVSQFATADYPDSSALAGYYLEMASGRSPLYPAVAV